MNPAADPLVLTLTGTLPALMIVSALLALPVALALLAMYRRAVQRSMLAAVPAAAASDDDPRWDRSRIAAGAGADDHPIPPDTLLRGALRGPWRLAAIYSAAGLAYALTLAAAWSGANPAEAAPLRFVVVTWLYAWPVVLTVGFVAATRRVDRLALALGYAVVLALFGVFGLEDRGEWWTIFLAWGAYNALPTLLLLVFLHRRIRAVGPMVVAFLTLTVLGAATVLTILAREWAQRIAVEIGAAMEWGARELVMGAGLVGLVIFGVGGWFAVRWIRLRYERKELSDQTLLLDSLWLLFAAAHCLFFAFDGVAWVLSGPAAFVVYKGVARAGLALHGMGSESGPRAPTLLLLRVFSLGRRSEALFDLLTLHWRHVGSVRLIAGPDLATTTLEPHELLDYLTGKLARRFIDGPRALEQRMDEMDPLPDRDGRYRVDEFFCRADTWKRVLARLVEDSDAVLMDLRGFSRSNAGCRHEIEALIDQVPLSRVVLVTDATTDQDLLGQVIEEGWMKMGPDSPNHGARPAEPFRLALGGAAGPGPRELLHAACAAAGHAQPARIPS